MSLDQARLLRAASRATRTAGIVSSKEEFVNVPVKSSRRAARHLGSAAGGTDPAADHGEGPFLVADGRSEYAADPAPLLDVQVKPAFERSPLRHIQSAIERSPSRHCCPVSTLR